MSWRGQGFHCTNAPIRSKLYHPEANRNTLDIQSCIIFPKHIKSILPFFSLLGTFIRSVQDITHCPQTNVHIQTESWSTAGNNQLGPGRNEALT